MRDDILRAFCNGKRPMELIKENVASKKTVYYYHSIYSDMVKTVKSDAFTNEMIKLLLNLRIKA